MRRDDEEGDGAPDLAVEQSFRIEVEGRDELGLGGGEERGRRGHRGQEAGESGNSEKSEPAFEAVHPGSVHGGQNSISTLHIE